ncbi:MAG TPA: FAD-dependent oxidoreductase [Steroidobacteraceae bacterium]
MKIAIIGSGIAGNLVARQLHREHEITVFEAAGHIGGHAHTHRIEIGGQTLNVDTGFIVFNDRTYPNFTRLLGEIGVASQDSAMSFSVRNERTGLEYNGTSFNGLFAQRRNLLRWSFHRMWREILRFNREAVKLLDSAAPADLTLADYLHGRNYSAEFVGNYLVPMAAAIWSAPPAQVSAMPARFLIGFFHHHGMLTVSDRPQWRTIVGGSARYVEKLVAPFRARIHLNTPIESVRRLPGQVQIKPCGAEALAFDRVFLACHSDQALALLADATTLEREVLGCMSYQENEAVLHTDERLLPRTRGAWAAWNYCVPRAPAARVSVTYNMNILQKLAAPATLCVTLNGAQAIDPTRVLRRVSYQHPVFTAAAVAAQQRHAELNGCNRSYFCGAYWRHGFHEDGVVSAQQALEHFYRDLGNAQRAVHRVG